LREACLLALRVAAEGEVAEPRVPSPPAVRPLFGFKKFSAAAYRTLMAAVDVDEDFRLRVADEADEDLVGRAGLLWLTRPEGWELDEAFTAGGDPSINRSDRRPRRSDRSDDDQPDRNGGGRDGARLARARQQVESAEAARRRAADQRDQAVAELEQLRVDHAAITERVDLLDEERRVALRAQKQLEKELAEARRDLRLAREAARQAEAELLSRPVAPAAGSEEAATTHAAGATAASERATDADPTADLDLDAIRAAVTAAAAGASELARALDVAARSLDPLPAPSVFEVPDPSAGPVQPSTRPDGRKDKKGRGRPRRRSVTFPPGLMADSPEARRHLVNDPTVLVVVDGYNLAREAWSGLLPEEERRRTVALLEEAAVRSGGSVTVVFDGDDTSTAPPASRVLRVLFSASGVTADEEIAALVATVPLDQAVLVVSTDREVADDARRQGAAVLSSAEYLAALGR